MILTERDKKVVEFIEKCPCRADVIEKLFYPSTRVCNRRLQKLADYKYIKRMRENQNEHYFYFTGRKPRQLEHMNLTAKSLIWIKSKGYNIVKFKREVSFSEGIRPDAVIGIERDGEFGVIMVEIERFNNSLKKKIEVYEKVYNEKKYFKSFKILYVCNKKVSSKEVEVINIRPIDL